MQIPIAYIPRVVHDQSDALVAGLANARVGSGEWHVVPTLQILGDVESGPKSGEKIGIVRFEFPGLEDALVARLPMAEQRSVTECKGL